MTLCSTNRPLDQSSCLAAALGANKLTPAKDVVLSKLDLGVKHPLKNPRTAHLKN